MSITRRKYLIFPTILDNFYCDRAVKSLVKASSKSFCYCHICDVFSSLSAHVTASLPRYLLVHPCYPSITRIMLKLPTHFAFVLSKISMRTSIYTSYNCKLDNRIREVDSFSPKRVDFVKFKWSRIEQINFLNLLSFLKRWTIFDYFTNQSRVTLSIWLFLQILSHLLSFV